MKILSLLLLLQSVSSLNIVFYLLAIGKSHLQFTSQLIDTLVERGHDVDLIIARFNSGFDDTNGTKKTTRVLNFGFPGGSPWMEADHLHDPFTQKEFKYELFTKTSNLLTKIALESGGPLRFLKEKKYDLALISSYDFLPYTLMYQAGIETVLTFSSMPLFPLQASHIGLPNIPSVVSNPFQPNTDRSMGFCGRTSRFLFALLFHFVIPSQTAFDDAMAQKHFPGMPSITELIDRTDIVFVNSNEIVELPRPVSHKIKYIGGIGLPKPKPLAQEISSLLDAANGDAVVFSFGTQVPTANIPYAYRKAFFSAFMRFPHLTFLWKYDIVGDEEDLIQKATNVKLLSWLPQTDLLNDDRVIAFISHMGLNSFLESAYAGVPIVAIPLFADQQHNTELGKGMGTVVEIKKTNVTEENVYNALKRITTAPSFRIQAQRYAALLKNRPEPAKERFIHWVEFAAKNKDLHNVLNLPGHHLSVVEYYCIDSVIFLVGVLFASLFILYYVIKKALGHLRNKLWSKKKVD